MPDEEKIRPLTLPEQLSAETSEKVQCQVDTYTHWVLDRLVGIKGRNLSDVVYFLLRDWIQEHKEELEHLGITVEVARGRLVVRHGKSVTSKLP